MMMSESEIVTFYRQAADQKKQIKILAELNGTSKERIESILSDAGYDLHKKRRKPGSTGRTRRSSCADLYPKFKEFYDLGLSDREIGLRSGCTSSPVRNWRIKNNLPLNCKQGWNGKRKKDETIP
ncbi:MAG: hypothetical protein NC548_40030 [Lachnospiraceae bacterium]|nr:hypothetical protein [Lachnospiraceae bacterium]MCM1232962.1 hypothetical protein [Ruminococcus flavefaciens]